MNLWDQVVNKKRFTPFLQTDSAIFFSLSSPICDNRQKKIGFVLVRKVQKFNHFKFHLQ